MKKQTFLLSLLSISLFSCGNNKTDDSIVNEQEMYDALTLKGVECLQVNSYDQENPTFPAQKSEISPNRYHYIRDYEGSYREYYLFQEGDTKETIKEWLTEDKGKPLEEVEYKDDFFGTIENFRESTLGPIVDKEYKDFEYQNDTKEYIVHFEEEYSGKCVSAIKFFKKKVIEFTTWEESKDREHFSEKGEFGYEEIVPVPPVVV